LGKCALPATAKRLSHLDPDQGGTCGRPPRWPIARRLHHKEQPMLDAILLAVGLGFFALSIAYAFGCDRL
jgi:hypothetical protein